MVSKLALALVLVASLSACNSPTAPTGSNAAEKDAVTSARAKWPLPAETAEPAQPAVNETAKAEPEAGNNQMAVAETKPPEPKALPSDDPATFRASGTEPFWAVKIFGGTLVLDMPGKPSRYYSVTRSMKGDVRRYTGDGIQLSSTSGACNDGMSDRTYEDRVQIATSDGTFKGCGAARR
jgi:uncharacterized membrane protein